jgi:hypothetical protein
MFFLDHADFPHDETNFYFFHNYFYPTLCFLIRTKKLQTFPADHYFLFVHNLSIILTYKCFLQLHFFSKNSWVRSFKIRWPSGTENMVFEGVDVSCNCKFLWNAMNNQFAMIKRLFLMYFVSEEKSEHPLFCNVENSSIYMMSRHIFWTWTFLIFVGNVL